MEQGEVSECELSSRALRVLCYILSPYHIRQEIQFQIAANYRRDKNVTLHKITGLVFAFSL